MRADIEPKTMTFDDFIQAADDAVIDDAYKRAGRVVTADWQGHYSEYLAGKVSEGEDPEDALIRSTVVAALGLIADSKGYLESEAEKLSNQWLTKYRVAIRA